MRRRLLGAGAWSFAGRAGFVLAALGVSTAMTRLLPPAEVGAYALAASVAAVGALVGGGALNQVVVRFAAAGLAVGDPLGVGRTVTRCIWLGAGGAALAGVTYLAVADDLVGRLAGAAASALPSPLVAAWIVAASVLTLFAECLRGVGDLRGAAVYGGPFASLLLLVLLLVIGATHAVADLSLVVSAAVVATASAAVLAAGSVRARLRALTHDQRPVTPAAWAGAIGGPGQEASGVPAATLVATAMPLLLTGVAFVALTQADLWVVGMYREGTEIAVYAMAARVAALAGLPIFVVTTALLPVISEMFARGDLSSLARVARAGALVAAAPAACCALLFAAAGGPLLGALYGPAYRGGGTALAVLATGYVIAAGTGPCGAILAMCGGERAALVLAATTGLLVVGGLLAVVPRFGIVGAAVVAALGLAAQNVAMLLAARRRTGVWACVGSARGGGPGRHRHRPWRHGPKVARSCAPARGTGRAEGAEGAAKRNDGSNDRLPVRAAGVPRSTGGSMVADGVAPADRVKVVYIEGSGRSGTTLLDTLLGQVDGFFSTGELAFLWDRARLPGELCGCGVPATRCRIWSRVTEATLGAPAVNPAGLAWWRDHAISLRETPLALTALLDRRVRTRAADQLRLLETTYRTAAGTAGARVLVDSSKSPQYGYLLRLVPGLEVCHIHVVRDPRAVAFSWTRDRSAERLYPRPVIRSALDWVLWQVLSGLLSRRHRHRHLRVRYEDLVSDPTGTLRRILDHCGEAGDLGFVRGHVVILRPNHTVSGNPGRFRTGSQNLAADVEWETRMRRRDVAAVTAICLPWLVRHRYPLRRVLLRGAEAAAAGGTAGSERRSEQAELAPEERGSRRSARAIGANQARGGAQPAPQPRDGRAAEGAVGAGRGDEEGGRS